MKATFAVVLALAAVVLIGCSEGDYTARFLAYGELEDGTRIAIVAPEGQGADPGQIEAFTKIDDLRPGERVRVEYIGRDWDQPQWMPTAQVLTRADDTARDS